MKQQKTVFVHQASKVVVDGIEKELINAPRLHRNYENRGNTVSSTIPILIKDKKIDINSINSILSGFGVGLMSYTVGIEILRMKKIIFLKKIFQKKI